MSTAAAAAPPLLRRVPEGAALEDPGAILDRFLGWIAETGLEPYAHQEEALLELLEGNHVVLDTPTGSGKSLVALGLHFRALCLGKRSFYTAPIKALVSEKFFALCELFGARNVGMLTGDASINWAAPIVCCTAEVLSNMALRQGERADAPCVVMDEFHYYADRDRGSAWQIPLLLLPHTQFLLMSATLGNPASIAERLEADSGRKVAHVHSAVRPVPLDFDYRESTLHETVEDLLETGRAPVYVVNFTQRECAEQAQALTSARVADRELRQKIGEALADFRFDTPYGKDMRRVLSHGIGIHHAGLLPKYRLLVEQLSQQGLLRVICGTDTLGVGVNIPIRSVLFSKLSKFDGEKVRLLPVRGFQQIAGRAGRKGFDERGSVVCQAPEHVVENRRALEKGAAGGKSKKKGKKSPPRGFVAWNRQTFDKLVAGPPETLESSFRVDHGLMLNLLQREPELLGRRGGYGALAALVGKSHERPVRKRRLLREAAVLFRALRGAEIVDVERDPASGRSTVRVRESLQREFSLHQSLSLYLVEAIAALDPEDTEYALQVVSLVEAILENPRALLFAQERKLKSELMARLKAERVPYEERLERLEEVTWPKPDAEFIYATFRIFEEKHPWVGDEAIRPKGIAREMIEGFSRFDSYVKEYGLERIEGLLLRYLGQVWSTLQRTVPDAAKTEAVWEAIAYLRALIERVDSSLLQEWEALVHPERRLAPGEATAAPPPREPELTPQAFRARLRAELHTLVHALADADYAEAAACLRADPDDPWDAARLEAELAPFLAEHERIVFDPRARQAHLTVIKPTGPKQWDVSQVLCDPAGEDLWCLEGQVDLRSNTPEGPLFSLHRITT